MDKSDQKQVGDNMYNVNIESGNDITEEEIDNLLTLYNTPMGTIPMEREKGIDFSYVDMPEMVAQNMFAAEVIQKTKKYSNNIEATSVSFESQEDGVMNAKVVIQRGE